MNLKLQFKGFVSLTFHSLKKAAAHKEHSPPTMICYKLQIQHSHSPKSEPFKTQYSTHRFTKCNIPDDGSGVTDFCLRNLLGGLLTTGQEETTLAQKQEIKYLTVLFFFTPNYTKSFD